MSPQDVIWSFAGVRELADAGPGKAQAASRDYRLDLDGGNGTPPLLAVLGGKITSYRTLAEDVAERLADVCPQESRLRTTSWTASQPLPGGDLPPVDLAAMGKSLLARHLSLQPATRRAGLPVTEAKRRSFVTLWSRQEDRVRISAQACAKRKSDGLSSTNGRKPRLMCCGAAPNLD